MQKQPEQLKTLEQKIEDARSILAITEENYKRFQNLNKSEEYKLGELNKAIAECESKNKELESTKSSLLKEITLLQENKSRLTLEVSSVEKELTDIKIQSEKHKSDMQVSVANVQRMLAEVSSKEEDLMRREKLTKDLELEVQNKHSKIKAFANQL